MGGAIFRAAVEQDLGRGFRYVEPSSAEKPALHEVPTILVGPGLWKHLDPGATRRNTTAAAAGAQLARGLHTTLAPDMKMLWRAGGGRRSFPEDARDLSFYRKHYAAGACAGCLSCPPRVLSDAQLTARARDSPVGRVRVCAPPRAADSRHYNFENTQLHERRFLLQGLPQIGKTGAFLNAGVRQSQRAREK